MSLTEMQGRWINPQHIREMRLETRNGKTWTVIEMTNGGPVEVRGDWTVHIVGAAAPVIAAPPGWSVLSYHPGFGGQGNTDRNADVCSEDIAAWRVDDGGLLPVTANSSGLGPIALWPRDWASHPSTYIRSPDGKVKSDGGTVWLSERQWLDEMRDPNREEKQSEHMGKINQEIMEFKEWRRQRAESGGAEPE